MTCRVCGAPHREIAKFSPRCGTVIAPSEPLAVSLPTETKPLDADGGLPDRANGGVHARSIRWGTEASDILVAWVCAHTLGSLALFVTPAITQALVELSRGLLPRPNQIVIAALVILFVTTQFGLLLMAIAEWEVLKLLVRGAPHWIWLTVLAQVLAVPVGAISQTILASLFRVGVTSFPAIAGSFAVIGVLTGFMQWLFLRRHFRHASLWILASFLGISLPPLLWGLWVGTPDGIDAMSLNRRPILVNVGLTLLGGVIPGVALGAMAQPYVEGRRFWWAFWRGRPVRVGGIDEPIPRRQS